MKNVIGISQTSISGIIPLSIHNKIPIDSLDGAKPNEPSWSLFSIPPTSIKTMHLWKFRKQQALAFLIVQLGY
jgi:hypothetical protein